MMNPKPKNHPGLAPARRRAGLGQRLAALLAATLVLSTPAIANTQHETPAVMPKPAAVPPANKGRVDSSGLKRVGMASFYARRFAGRKMANGGRMKLESDYAASRTLPLGTKARVTNLSTGTVAIVTITDRGPYAAGRIIDLSPRVARQLGITGLARVEVSPLALPQADGSVRPVYALADAGRTHGQGLKTAL